MYTVYSEHLISAPLCISPSSLEKIAKKKGFKHVTLIVKLIECFPRKLGAYSMLDLICTHEGKFK